ncbi:PEGA domain-containing protein [Myxococcus qinghaiensis]|uniref:PEGA domain-containing protein n=1 Tax=Myxococcus qinghaiensis TaxID=2906758 RepID=UPI0020A80594|nr:PEGA domain-containing protein [Myxococcus qinghaiensis]MCP3162749.1 PEGA domain-containing protein [Myxococcus qinghaiensis]
MSIRRLVLFSLVAVLAAPSSALAQADDFLAPLTPSKTTKAKPAKTKVVKKKKAAEKVTKKPAARPKATAKGSKKKNLPPPDDSMLAPLAPVKTELAVVITGTVKGARLTLDGRDAGVLTPTPLTLTVTPGEHSLVVRKPGYEEYTRRLDVKEGSTAEVKVSLVATMGFARAFADVAGTVVLVDDIEVGTVPMSDILLKPGSREIEFRAQGYKPHVHNINVLAGTTYELTGRMRPLVDTGVASNTPRVVDTPRAPVLDPSTTMPDEPNPALAFDSESPDAQVEGSSKPWYGRWYVWAGVGAVVAAGTVGAVMATRDPTIKTIDDPNTICTGGRCDIVFSKNGNPRSKVGAGAYRPVVGGFRF